MKNFASDKKFDANIKLSFNDDEKYIKDKVKELSSSHNIARFVCNLIRIAFDDPKTLKYQEELRETLIFMDRTSITPIGDAHYKEVRREIAEMHEKVDAIYDMCLRMYTASLYRDTLNMSKNIESMITAEYESERLINKLCTKLGITVYKPFKAARVFKVQNEAEETLDYLIEKYGGVLDEISAGYRKEPGIVYVQAPDNGGTVVDKKVDTIEETNNSNKENTGTFDFEGGDPIDFGDEPIGLDDDAEAALRAIGLF